MIPIDLHCLVVGADGVGKSTFIGEISDPSETNAQDRTMVLKHESLNPSASTQNQINKVMNENNQKIYYVIHFHEKLIKQGQPIINSYDLQQNQLFVVMYDLQDIQSFNVVQQGFQSVEQDLKETMRRAYDSENKQQQAFIGISEDESLKEFTDKLVQMKSKKMMFLLGNKVDFDYDSQRKVPESKIEQLADRYQELGMIQAEISCQEQTGLNNIVRAMKFHCQKFLTDQDLANVVKIADVVQPEQEKKSVTTRVNVPKFGKKQTDQKHQQQDTQPQQMQQVQLTPPPPPPPPLPSQQVPPSQIQEQPHPLVQPPHVTEQKKTQAPKTVKQNKFSELQSNQDEVPVNQSFGWDKTLLQDDTNQEPPDQQSQDQDNQLTTKSYSQLPPPISPVHMNDSSKSDLVNRSQNKQSSNMNKSGDTGKIELLTGKPINSTNQSRQNSTQSLYQANSNDQDIIRNPSQSSLKRSQNDLLQSVQMPNDQVTQSKVMKFTNRKLFKLKAEEMVREKRSSSAFGDVVDQLMNQSQKPAIDEHYSEEKQESVYSKIDDFEQAEIQRKSKILDSFPQQNNQQQDSSSLNQEKTQQESLVEYELEEDQIQEQQDQIQEQEQQNLQPFYHHNENESYDYNQNLQQSQVSEQEVEDTYNPNDVYDHIKQGPKLIFQAEIGDKPYVYTKEDEIKNDEQHSPETKLSTIEEVNDVQIPVVQGSNHVKNEKVTYERSTQIEFNYIEQTPKQKFQDSPFPHIQELFDRHGIQHTHPRVQRSIEPIAKPLDSHRKSSSQMRYFELRRKPLMNIQFNLQRAKINVPIFEGDNSFSVTYKLAKRLKISTSVTLVQRLSEVIEQHINHYCDRLQAWGELRQMGVLTSAKWKSMAHKQPEFLQKIEDENENDFNVSYLQRQHLEVSYIMPKPPETFIQINPSDRIGLLHVEDHGKVETMEIYRGIDPAKIVQNFMAEKAIPYSDQVYLRLYDQVDKIQTQWELKQRYPPTLSKSPRVITTRDKTPPSQQIHLQQIHISNVSQVRSNPNIPLFTMDLQIGKDRQAKLTLEQGQSIKKAVDKFCYKHKLNNDMRKKLLLMVEQNYQNKNIKAIGRIY